MGKVKTYKIISGLLLILTIVAGISAIYSLYLLTGIETFYRIIVMILLALGLITLIYSLLDSIKYNKKKKFIITSLFSGLFIIISLIIAIIIFVVYGKLNNTTGKTDDLHTTLLLSIEEKPSIDKLKDQKIGIIENTGDIEGNILPNEVITKYKLKDNNEIIEYTDSIALLSALVKKEIDIIFVSEDYEIMLKNIEGIDANQKFYEIARYEKIIKKDKTEDNISSDPAKLNKPFTILLLGADNDSKSFNGDTIMLVTFNPQTLNATMFSIPRDTYVPICSAYSKKCGAESKITHSAWSGAQGVVNTVENFTGIKIDYYVKINFKGLIDLVNILGGIEVDVPVKFCESNEDRLIGPDYEICLEKGLQTLNGQQALALARHRKTLPLGDFQRGQNQQLVVEGMVNKIKNVRSVTDFYNILDTLSKNLETSMTTEEMLGFYNLGKSILLKDEDVSINITKTFLTGYDLYIYEGYSSAYTFQYYKQSLAPIVKAMKVNLGLETKEEIKNFSFSIKEPYEKTIIGYKYYSEPRRTLIPDFTQYSLAGAEAWASSRGLTITTTEVAMGDYDGQIIAQSVHAGVLLEKSPKTINLTIAKLGSGNNTTEPPIKPEEPDEEETPIIPGGPDNPENPDKPDEGEEKPDKPDKPDEGEEKPDKPDENEENE